MFKLNLVQTLLCAPLSLALFQLPVSAQVLYTAEYARSVDFDSLPKVETVITIRNPSTLTCSIQVNWLDPNGFVVGVSGPSVLGFNQTREFTTANPGEIAHPFLLDVFRNSVNDFEGTAQIISPNCSTISKLGVNASLVTYYKSFTAFETPPSFMTISVTKGTTGRNGD